MKSRADAFAPQLATLVATPPDGATWSFEIKYDGYRALAAREDGEVVLRSRNGLVFPAFPPIVRRLGSLGHGSLVVDGELCVLDDAGRPRFELLQTALSARVHHDIVYFVFDLLVCDGEDLRAEPLAARQARLRSLLRTTSSGPVRRVVSHDGSGSDFLEATRALGLEGMIAKRIDRPYRSGRSRDWLKIKTEERAELVVVGFTPPSGSRQGLGSLLLGVHDDVGRGRALKYAGKVGSGFDAAALLELTEQLERLEVKEAPVIDPPRMKQARWVRPSIVVEVRFSEWTSEGRLRHPVFLGLRTDKAASTVKRDRVAPLRGSRRPSTARARSGA